MKIELLKPIECTHLGDVILSLPSAIYATINPDFINVPEIVKFVTWDAGWGRNALVLEKFSRTDSDRRNAFHFCLLPVYNYVAISKSHPHLTVPLVVDNLYNT